MYVRNVTISVVVTKKTSVRAQPIILVRRTLALEQIVTKTPGTIHFGVSPTIPSVFGAYSSMGVQVAMTIPADTDKIKTKEDFKKALGGRENVVVEFMQDSVNEACVAAGIDKVF